MNMKSTAPSRDAELILGAFECLVDGKKAVYIAVPITTGIRLWELARECKISDLREVPKKHPKLFRESVLKPNLKDAKRASDRVRRKHFLAIDPSRLMVAEWSQDDYVQLWRSVLETRVERVALSPNWVYSLGCLEEYMTASVKGVKVTDLEGRAVTRRDAEREIEQALSNGKSWGINTSYLRSALRQLKAS